jgi:putative ABC transport system permease protein
MLSALKLAFRPLAKSPGFTAVVVLTLALGIGVNTALFSVINSLLFRPLPLGDLDRLVFPIARDPDSSPMLNSPAEYDAWRTGSREHIAWGAAVSNAAVFVGRDEPQQLRAASIDEGYLATLGVAPARGRAFTAAEIRAGAPVALLTHGLWQRVFGGAPDAVGRTFRLDGRLHTVVGIMPPGFDLPIGNDLYVPYVVPAPGSPTRPDRGLFVVARLAPGATLARSNIELKALSARLAAAEPAQKGWSVGVLPLRRQLLEDINGSLNQRLAVLLGAVGLLLLVACANVGNLILARTLGRTHELAIRTALGASRGRIVRQLLAENTALAALGAAAGTLLAAWLTPTLLAFSPVQPIALSNALATSSFDVRVLGFAAGATLLTLLLAGLPAALRASRLDLVAAIQSGGGRGSSRAAGGWRDALIVGEVALCLALLAGATLLGRSFLKLLDEPLGFDPRQVLSVRVAPPLAKYPDAAARIRFVDTILARVRALPGVQQAGVVSTLPLHLDGWSAAFRPETGPLAAAENVSTTTHRVATPGYLEAMGVRLVAGRLISPDDRAGTPRVAVVTENFAHRAWPGENALGRRLGRPRRPGEWITVVGVVAAVKEDRVAGIRGDGPAWYLPYAQSEFSDPVHIVVKSAAAPEGLGRAIAAAVRAVDPEQPVYETVALAPYVHAFLAPERFAAGLLAGLGALGLLLAALGIYGVSAFVVALRRREIGIRLALGDTPGGIQRRVFGRSLALCALGAVPGLIGVLLLGRGLGGLLHGLSAYDPATLAGVLGILTLATLAATWLPARRAARVDPMTALRAE